MPPLRPTGPYSAIGTATAWPGAPRESRPADVAAEGTRDSPKATDVVRPRPGAEGLGRAWRLEQLTADNADEVLARVRDGRLPADDVQIVHRGGGGGAAPRLPRDPEVQVRVLARLLDDPATIAVLLVVAEDGEAAGDAARG